MRKRFRSVKASTSGIAADRSRERAQEFTGRRGGHFACFVIWSSRLASIKFFVIRTCIRARAKMREVP
jgi:hypothetical protein